MERKKRILVVDDDTSITRFLKINLEETAAYVVRVENEPSAAVAAAEEFGPDLILLDVIMPAPDGGALAETLQTRPRLNGVPIAFLTAAATKQEVSAHRGFIGGLPFIAKPVSLKELIARIEELTASHPESHG